MNLSRVTSGAGNLQGARILLVSGIAAETGGRLGSAFSNFLKELVTSGLNFGESPEPDWTKEKRALFASRLRSAHVKTDLFPECDPWRTVAW